VIRTEMSSSLDSSSVDRGFLIVRDDAKRTVGSHEQGFLKILI